MIVTLKALLVTEGNIGTFALKGSLEEYGFDVLHWTNEMSDTGLMDACKLLGEVPDLMMVDRNRIDLLNSLRVKYPHGNLSYYSPYWNSRTFVKAIKYGAKAILHNPMDNDAFCRFFEHFPDLEEKIFGTKLPFYSDNAVNCKLYEKLREHDKAKTSQLHAYLEENGDKHSKIVTNFLKSCIITRQSTSEELWGMDYMVFHDYVEAENDKISILFHFNFRERPLPHYSSDGKIVLLANELKEFESIFKNSGLFLD